MKDIYCQRCGDVIQPGYAINPEESDYCQLCADEVEEALQSKDTQCNQRIREAVNEVTEKAWEYVVIAIRNESASKEEFKEFLQTLNKDYDNKRKS